MIDTVTIAGAPLDTCQVLAQVTVLHGRAQFGETAAPSSATIIVEQPAAFGMPTWQSGDTLALTGPEGAMFSGRVVERHLDHFTDPATAAQVGRFTITGAGALAALGVRKIGDAAWPQETGVQRAARILTAGGTPWRVEGATDYTVLPRDVDAQPAAGLLAALANDTRAAVFDTPTGEVVYQALSGRADDVFPYRWSDFPTSDVWSGFAPALTWDGNPPSIGQWPSPESVFPLPLPCSVVEWGLEWASTEAAVINHVRVGYGTAEPQATVELEDAGSIAAHARRYLYLGTQLATVTDANQLAADILTTQYKERWGVGEVVLALDLLDPVAYTAALNLVCGDQVELADLPQPAPALTWVAVVEGWTYTQHGQGGQLFERLTLAVSDPLHSLIVMTWAEYPSLYTWAQHPAFLTWNDVGNVEDLEVAA